MQLDRLDHLVLTVRDIAATVRFYREVLGMEEVTFGDGRKALRFGSQKINLHQVGHEIEPKAQAPTPGAMDICLVSRTPLPEVMEELAEHGVAILAGPIPRTGAKGSILSVYFRDPDENLIEISTYETES